MPSVYDFKPRFQAALRPTVKMLAERGVTANQVTLVAVGLSAFWGGLLALTRGSDWVLIGLPLVLFLRMALNAMDGMLARDHGQASRQGAMLNELGDVVSDTFLYLPFALIFGPLWLVPVILALWVEFTGVLPQSWGGPRRYDGPFGKSDRALAYGLLGLIHGLFPLPFPVPMLLAIGFSALALFTLHRRFQGALNA